MNLIEKFKTSFHFSGYKASYLQACKDDISKDILELEWLEHCKKKAEVDSSTLQPLIPKLEGDIISKTVEIVKKLEKLEWLKTL